MELELCLALPRGGPSKGLGVDLNGDASATAVQNKKRGFDDAFGGGDDAFGGGDDAIATLPLLHWASNRHATNSDNNGSDGPGLKRGDTGMIRSSGGGPVGWPPVKSAWRNAGGADAAKCVKVMMEGEAIGRKVDLSLHRSYATLLDALDHLFTRKPEEGGQVGLGRDGPPPLPARLSSRHRTFTYQDSDGDWMLLGDVPWETFIKSVKRLKIRCGSE